MKIFRVVVLSMILSGALVYAENNDTSVNAKSDYEQKARDVLAKIVIEQIEQIKETANSTGSKNEKNLKGYVLSSQIRTFSDIPKNIDNEINIIKEQTRLLIKKIALDIEINREGTSGVLSLDGNGHILYKPNPNLPEELNRKRKELLESGLKNNVSIRSASLALRLLVGINGQLVEQALVAKDRKLKERLYMTQAIYVYEISDIVLSLLDSLSLDGVGIINKLHADAKSRVSTNIGNISKQKEMAKKLKVDGLLSQENLDKELSSLDLIEKANTKSLNVWKNMLGKVGNQQTYLNGLKKKREIIAYKQSKAKIQIETLRDLRGAASLRDSIGSIDDIIDAVDQLDLLVLDEKAVTDLLGGYEGDQ